MMDTLNPKLNPHQRPQTGSFRGENIPDDLKQLNQWVSWTWEWKGKKWDKPPLRVGMGTHAKSTDPQTWTNYEHALRYVKNFELNQSGAFRGMGLVFTKADGFVGIDLDNCRNPASGEISQEAWEIIRQVNSYTEVSPSLTGVKIWVRGKIPDWSGHSNHEAGIEIYEAGRYYAMTGQIVAGTPRECRECQEQIEWLCGKYLKNGEPKKKKTQPRRVEKKHHLEQLDEQQDVLSALNAISNSPGVDFDTWLNIGMALHSFDQSLLGEWERWSAQSQKYQPGECERRWASFSRDGEIQIGTLFHHATQAGWIRPIRRDVGFTGPAGGPMHMDATAYAPLPEFAGETVFLPEFLEREESGPPESHSKACVCESCARKARTDEARHKEQTSRSCRASHLLSNGDVTFFGRVDCHCWHCQRCRKKHLIPKWERHLSRVVSRYERLEIGEVSHDQWKRATREIRDAGGDYFRIVTAQNEVLVVATAPFCGSQSVSRGVAQTALSFHLSVVRDFPSTRKVKSKNERAIVTSKAWRLKEPKRETRFKKIKVAQASDQTVRKAAAELRIKLEPLSLDFKGGIEFAKVILPPEYYGDHWSLLKAFAARVEDLAYPSENGPSCKPIPDSDAIELGDDGGFSGSLDNYPQDPLWTSPPPS